MLCALSCMNGRRSEWLSIRGVQPERAKGRQLAPPSLLSPDSVGRHGRQMSCRLCKNDEPLQNSHVIPEFLYRPSYDAKHRIGLVKAGLSKMQLRQKGIREPLLCRQCEQLLNDRYEQPMSKAWREFLPDEIDRDSHLIDGIDYGTFKLFHLSVLWRASVAQGSGWSD